MMGETSKPTLLVALGGNALIRKGQEGTVPQQFKNLAVPVRQIAKLSQDYRIIITHGNGPQVGNLLLQQESCREVPRLPLEITYVVVDENDPAFSNPSKPIGPAYESKREAPSGYPVIKTAKGFRRVVVSPKPVTIIEKREIKKLINTDFIVICCGGGGIPVVREGRAFQGVDAVIDKDLASARLAEEVGVDIFLIATDVAGVALNYGTPDEKFLRKIDIKAAERYITEGHFPAGTMAPKVEAAIQFIRNKGKRAVITSIEEIESAINEEGGTEITA
jgi:carbamate kinase